MTRRAQTGARFAAGALLLCASIARADAIRVAAQRADRQCPGKIPALVPVRSDRALPADSSRCIAILPLPDLSAAAVDAATETAGRFAAVTAVVVEIPGVPRPEIPEWRSAFAYAVKKISSAVRGGSPGASVAYDLTAAIAPGSEVELSDPDVVPYIDAFVDRPGRGRIADGEVPAAWLLIARSASGSAAGDLLRALAAADPARSVVLVGLQPGPERPVTQDDWQSLERLAAYWTADVSRDPTATRAAFGDGSSFEVLRYFDARRFTPILLLPDDARGNAVLELAGGPFVKASVENLASGARRDFGLVGAKNLTLDLSRGPLAVVLQPAQRPGGSSQAQVEVGAVRGLTAEEIIARERAWDSGQREKTESFIADLKTSLRFRIAEVNETFDLTIHGPLFYRRGQPADWEWDEFFLNGVRWKSKTLPKLPILQPEKVTTLPLDIRLTEDYDYGLHGEATVAGRHAYHITFSPKTAVGEKPIYRGSVWIDKETFALLRRDSVQLNLKGETLSNVQTEFYRPVPGHPDVLLPLEIKGEQVFSTAGRTTAIERDAVMQAVDLNPPDIDKRLAAAHASPAQMVRDTDRGMRYLVPDKQNPGQRVVEEKISKKSTFGLLGAFYDKSLDYPVPLLGAQYFNFDLWGKGKQLSVFFGGALLTTNYTDPSLGGSRFDLGADLFGVAFAFGDTSYRNGKEVKAEKIKHIPAVFQVNVGHPIGPYLKASLGLFTKWDNYQRDPDTGPAFVVPVDTFTDGAELRLVSNYSGFNATVTGSYFRRRRWEFWGDPATTEFDPGQKDYWKYSVSLSKDQYFPGFRKLHVSLSYLGGTDLDRFSKYEFGAFSGNAMHGFQSGSLRTEKALLANISYGINIEDIIRFEGFYDQGLLRDKVSGFHDTYFSGAGLLASFNGPWKNSLVRAEVGVPVVSHGVHGFVVNALLLKLF
jgi:MucB/RseB family protein